MRSSGTFIVVMFVSISNCRGTTVSCRIVIRCDAAFPLRLHIVCEFSRRLKQVPKVPEVPEVLENGGAAENSLRPSGMMLYRI